MAGSALLIELHRLLAVKGSLSSLNMTVGQARGNQYLTWLGWILITLSRAG